MNVSPEMREWFFNKVFLLTIGGIHIPWGSIQIS